MEPDRLPQREQRRLQVTAETLGVCPPSLWGTRRTITPASGRCGFSQSQEAYDSAAEKLFETLELLEARLAVSRYLCGDALTLADVCLFTTLIRFDLVYNVLFRCTRKKLLEYPNLHGYTRDIYQVDETNTRKKPARFF